MPMIFKGNNEDDPPMDLVASHQRLLIGAALRTTGPILELGVGWYSTPLLHEIANALGRDVYTLDNNMHWLAQFIGLQNNRHKFLLTGWWGELGDDIDRGALPGHFGLVFVDQGQPCEREYTTRLLLQRKVADVFVFHDTEEGFAYGYDRLLGNARYPNGHPKGRPDTLPRNTHWEGYNLGMFQYQWTDRCQKAWTTVASTCVDVTRWFKDLPPVEPMKEVT